MTERQVLDARTPRKWEQWLEANHHAASEIWLRLDRQHDPGYDDVSRIQRFSPRKPRSAWSTSNVERVQRLIDAGRMRQAGQRQIDAAKADGRWPTS